MEWKTLSGIGNRRVNEDSIGVFSHGDKQIFVLADGLGGHGKGNIASSLAVKAFEVVMSSPPVSLRALLVRSIRQAQIGILAEQRQGGNTYQMKTTVCALAVDRERLMWGHVGDSRLYAFARNKVKSRTLDHSVPQMLVVAHEIKEKEIRNHPDRNKLLRVLGITGNTPVPDLSEEFDAHKFQAFLLCSDGFWELILEKEMETALKKAASVDDWLQSMRATVEQRGSGTDMDNYSAIAVWM